MGFPSRGGSAALACLLHAVPLVLMIGASAASSRSEASTGTAPASGAVLLPAIVRADDGSRYLDRVPPASSSLLIVRVIDLRGDAPDAIGRTIEGQGKQRRERALVLNEPLAAFVHRAFTRMTAKDPPRGDAVAFEAGIEQFECGLRGSGLDRSEAVVDARLAVSVVTDRGPVPAGWLLFHAEESTTQPLATQGDLAHRAIAAFGQALARDELNLRDLAPAAAAEGASALPRRSLQVEYRGPETTYRKSRYETVAGWRGLARSDMRARYDGVFTLNSGETSWSTGRWGTRTHSSWLFGIGGKPGTTPGAWTIESSDLSMWSLGWGATRLYGLKDRERAGFAHPYVGLGIFLHGGSERIAVKATRLTSLPPFVVLERRDRSISAVRLAAGARSLAGVELRLGTKVVGVIEADWVQSADGTKWDMKKAGDMYDLVQRSNFNLTGWHVSGGLRWYPR